MNEAIEEIKTLEHSHRKLGEEIEAKKANLKSGVTPSKTFGGRSNPINEKGEGLRDER